MSAPDNLIDSMVREGFYESAYKHLETELEQLRRECYERRADAVRWEARLASAELARNIWRELAMQYGTKTIVERVRDEHAGLVLRGTVLINFELVGIPDAVAQTCLRLASDIVNQRNPGGG